MLMIQITNRTTPTISQGLLQVPVLFLILIMSAPVVEAKGSTEPLQPKTLRPPDISSPRDTLRSFKTNMNIILKYWDQGDFSRQTDQAFIRAIETLDLTTTPHSNSWGVRSGRVLLLHEATLNGGFGGELAARIAERAFEWLDAPLMRLAAPDSAVPYSPPLEAAFLPQVEQVVANSANPFFRQALRPLTFQEIIFIV